MGACTTVCWVLLLLLDEDMGGGGVSCTFGVEGLLLVLENSGLVLVPAVVEADDRCLEAATEAEAAAAAGFDVVGAVRYVGAEVREVGCA